MRLISRAETPTDMSGAPENQTDNVTLKLDLPSELEVVDDTTYLFTSHSPNGELVVGDLTSAGVNIGSYASDGMAWVITSVRFVGSPTTCQLVGQELVVTALSDTRRGNKSGPIEADAGIKCAD